MVTKRVLVGAVATAATVSLAVATSAPAWAQLAHSSKYPPRCSVEDIYTEVGSPGWGLIEAIDAEGRDISEHITFVGELPPTFTWDATESALRTDATVEVPLTAVRVKVTLDDYTALCEGTVSVVPARPFVDEGDSADDDGSEVPSPPETAAPWPVPIETHQPDPVPAPDETPAPMPPSDGDETPAPMPPSDGEETPAPMPPGQNPGGAGDSSSGETEAPTPGGNDGPAPSSAPSTGGNDSVAPSPGATTGATADANVSASASPSTSETAEGDQGGGVPTASTSASPIVSTSASSTASAGAGPSASPSASTAVAGAAPSSTATAQASSKPTSVQLAKTGSNAGTVGFASVLALAAGVLLLAGKRRQATR